MASVRSASSDPADLGSYELVILDETPPEKIYPVFVDASEDAIEFTWIASTGAVAYDIRFGTCTDKTIFDELPSLMKGEHDLVPGFPGEEQGYEAGELLPSTRYCLGIMLRDMAKNTTGPLIVRGKTKPCPVIP